MIAEIFATYLTTAGVLDYRPDDVGGDTFISGMPATPDVAVVLTETPGRPGDSKFAWDRPSLQVRARGIAEDEEGPREKIREIYLAIHGLRGIELPEEIWLISCRSLQSGASPMGQDENSRHEFVQNFETEIESPVLGLRSRF